jgi:AmmeMemoRadiSam system protein B
MPVRRPIVAGRFYPADRDGCVEEIRACLERPLPEKLPETVAAGIVPHAGWFFSGATAGMVFSAVKKQNGPVDTFVIFGAAHGYFGRMPAVYATGAWSSPLGDIPVDVDFAALLLDSGKAVADASAHASEHSIEVQVPFVQHLFGAAKLVPVVVACNDRALSLGRAAGEIIAAGKKKVVCIGSTDLTHYGPGYGFTPMGTGPEAFEWASGVNDGRFIDLALEMRDGELPAAAAEDSSACGGGAAAAAVAAAKSLGRTAGVLLEHTDSNRIMREKTGAAGADSVGYAAIVF